MPACMRWRSSRPRQAKRRAGKGLNRLRRRVPEGPLARQSVNTPQQQKLVFRPDLRRGSPDTAKRAGILAQGENSSHRRLPLVLRRRRLARRHLEYPSTQASVPSLQPKGLFEFGVCLLLRLTVPEGA